MKKIIRFAAWGLVSCFALNLASCSDDDSGGRKSPPLAVKLSLEGTPAFSSVSFRIASTDADRAAWKILPDTESAPDAETLLRTGTVVDFTESVVQTAEFLVPSTAYTVYAVGAKGDAVGRVATLKVTTAASTEPIRLRQIGKNQITYRIEMPEGTRYGHVCMMKRDVDSYLAMAATPADYENFYRMMLQLYGTVGTEPADYVFRDLQAMPNGPAARVVAGIQYVVIACPLADDGSFSGSSVTLPVRTPDPELLTQTIRVEAVSVKPEEIALQITPEAGIANIFESMLPEDLASELAAKGGTALLEQIVGSGSRISEFGEPSEWYSLQSERNYMHYVIGVDADGNRTALIENKFTTPAKKPLDTENIAFDRFVSAAYWGATVNDQGQTVYNYYVELADREMIKDPDYGDVYPADEGAGNVLICDFYTATQGGGTRLATGVYRLADSFADFTLNPGYTWAAGFDEEGNETRMEFLSGAILVEQVGAGYRMTVQLVTDQQKAYTGTFTGEITFRDASESSAPAAGGAPRAAVRKAARPVRR